MILFRPFEHFSRYINLSSVLLVKSRNSRPSTAGCSNLPLRIPFIVAHRKYASFQAFANRASCFASLGEATYLPWARSWISCKRNMSTSAPMRGRWGLVALTQVAKIAYVRRAQVAGAPAASVAARRCPIMTQLTSQPPVRRFLHLFCQACESSLVSYFR